MADSSVMSSEFASTFAQLRSLVRFHSYSGARVALRANGIIGAAVVFLFGLEDDALARLRELVLELVARHGSTDARMELAAVSVALAAVAMPRVTLGATGWMRSLAFSSAASRRAAIIALCGTQAFSIAVALLAAIGCSVVYHVPLDVAKIAAIPVMFVAAAAVVLPVQRAAARVLAALALALTVPGRWPFTAAAALVLVMGDAVSGGIVPFRRKRAHTPWRWTASASPVAQWMRFTTFALPARTLVADLLLPAVFVAFAYFIVRHNPDLDPATAHRTVRVCGMLALLAFAAALATSIVRGRPAWPWARSLPWSSSHRVLGDSLILGAGLLVIPLSLVPLDWRSAAIVAFVVPPMAAAACASIRAGARRQTSAGGEIALYAVAFGTAIALWPWTAGIAVCTTPLVFQQARDRERRLLVTRWEELHHDAAGDPAWTSAS